MEYPFANFILENPEILNKKNEGVKFGKFQVLQEFRVCSLNDVRRFCQMTRYEVKAIPVPCCCLLYCVENEMILCSMR